MKTKTTTGGSFLSCPFLNGGIALANLSLKFCCMHHPPTVKDFAAGEVMDDACAAMVAAARENMLGKLNAGLDCECSGCRHLERKIWEKPSHLFTYANITNNYRCNLSCTFCCCAADSFYPKRTGAKYGNGVDALSFMRALLEGGHFSPGGGISFADGEPIIQPYFEEMLRLVVKNRLYMELVSNLTVHSGAIEPWLEANHGRIVTSPDAGTPETFKRIKGRDLYDAFANNLARYARLNPAAVVPKYICVPENSNIRDRDGFLDLVQRCGLGKIILQYANIADDPMPDTEVLDFYAGFKDAASMRGLTIEEYGHEFWEQRDPVAQRIGSAYRRGLERYRRLTTVADGPPAAAGRIETIIRARDGGLWIGGWVYDKQAGRCADEVVLFWGSDPLFAGVCRWRMGHVHPDEKTGFSFHSPERDLANAALANPGEITALARFGGEWRRLRNTAAGAGLG